MKKYLISGALALIAGLFVTSCTHDDDVYNGDVATQKTEAFQKAFVSAFGEINPNQNWGFYQENLASIVPAAARKSRTRTVDTNLNEWEQKGYNVPSPITPDSREYEVVMNYFRTTPKPESQPVDLHNYFIQNVGYTDHTYYAYYQKDGRTETVTITNPGIDYMNLSTQAILNIPGRTVMSILIISMLVRERFSISSIRVQNTLALTILMVQTMRQEKASISMVLSIVTSRSVLSMWMVKLAAM